MKVKEIVVTIRPAPQSIKDYSAVDVRIRFNSVERELRELLPDSDFMSKFDQMIELVKKEVLNTIKELEE